METVSFFTFGVLRDVVNFIDMACEKSSTLSQEPLSTIVRPIFVLISGCFALKQGKALIDRFFCRIPPLEEMWHEKIGPSLANILNMAASVAVVVYYFGLITHPALRVLGNAYRLIPYATNIFCHFKDFKDLKSLCGLFSQIRVGQARFEGDSMARIKAALKSYAENTEGMASEVGETLKDLLPTSQAIDQMGQADETTLLLNRIGAAVELLKQKVEKIELLDLCINVTSFLLGVAYVALMCQYGVVPGELAFYGFLFFHIAYDLCKKAYLQNGLENAPNAELATVG